MSVASWQTTCSASVSGSDRDVRPNARYSPCTFSPNQHMPRLHHSYFILSPYLTASNDSHTACMQVYDQVLYLWRCTFGWEDYPKMHCLPCKLQLCQLRRKAWSWVSILHRKETSRRSLWYNLFWLGTLGATVQPSVSKINTYIFVYQYSTCIFSFHNYYVAIMHAWLSFWVCTNDFFLNSYVAIIHGCHSRDLLSHTMMHTVFHVTRVRRLICYCLHVTTMHDSHNYQ